MGKALPTIPRKVLTKVPDNGTGPHFVADASELQHGHGWKGFPMGFYLPGNLGNGEPMVRNRVERNADGDVPFVKYSQSFGVVEVTIFND